MGPRLLLALSVPTRLLLLPVVLSPAIFGHNGSGKSNVLLGVAFALGDVGNSASERRMLLHQQKQQRHVQQETELTAPRTEGLQGRVASGFVELALNNSQRRLCMVSSAFMPLPTTAKTLAAKAAAAQAISASAVTVTAAPASLQIKALLNRTVVRLRGELLVSGPSASLRLLARGKLDSPFCCCCCCSSVAVAAAAGGLRGSRGSSSKSSFIIRQGRIQEDRLKLLMAAGGGGFLQAKAEETETILQQAGPAA
ncbi:hypothetical protein Emag_004861 [Eimeria magna]